MTKADKLEIDRCGFRYTQNPPPPCKLSDSFLLQFVEEVVEGRNALLQSLPLPGVGDDDVWLAASLERVSGENLPVVKYALRESLHRKRYRLKEKVGHWRENAEIYEVGQIEVHDIDNFPTCP